MTAEPHPLTWYVPAAVLGVAFLAKLPGLRRGWRNPMVRAVNAMLLLPCVTFACSAPPTVRLVNRLTGIDNFSAVFVHCVLSAYACASVVLVEYWRAGPEAGAATRRRVRGWLLCYAVVIVAVVVLFALGEAPVERPVDFDLHYAATPFLREMSVVYLTGLSLASFATMVMCWNWAGTIGNASDRAGATPVVPWLKIGLQALVLGSSANFLFGAAKLTVIAATWAGRDWSMVGEGMAPFMALCGALVGLGFLTPVVGPWLAGHVWHPYAKVFALRWLWRAAHPPAAAGCFRALVGTPWYLGPEHLLMYRMTAIHDWLLGLYAYCPEDVRELAHRDATEAGAPERRARAIGIAAMLKAATEDRARRCTASEEQRLLAARVVGAAEAADAEILVCVSRALPTAPGRAELYARARRAEPAAGSRGRTP
ncbi:DUF6545 domain-containing protein [Streptomyces sp. NPDC101118]|uniref:DUF6545 domain-containing protein n=1 Tax=Streptomyces sp. NPDC101118 TaxID=3366109 RepID=UPI003824969D